MSTEVYLEGNATLTELQQTPVDNVLSTIDQGLVYLPSYRELYYRWERQQWSSHEIDFIPDRIQWEDMTDEEQENSLFGLATFFQGEACVTDALAPYVIAMPDEEMRIFVTTQLVDESRHTVFFARFFNEVLGVDEGSLEATLQFAQQFMNTQSKYILVEALTDTASRIRQAPDNLSLLVEGVVLYHVIAEGTMALAGQRALLEAYREDNIFPAFRGGFTAVTRDESRHVIFGVKFLREIIQKNPSYAQVAVRALEKYAPIAIAAVTPSEKMLAQFLANKQDPWSTPRYAQTSLQKKLKVIGLKMQVPHVPSAPVF